MTMKKSDLRASLLPVLQRPALSDLRIATLPKPILFRTSSPLAEFVQVPAANDTGSVSFHFSLDVGNLDRDHSGVCPETRKANGKNNFYPKIDLIEAARRVSARLALYLIDPKSYPFDPTNPTSPSSLAYLESLIVNFREEPFASFVTQGKFDSQYESPATQAHLLAHRRIFEYYSRYLDLDNSDRFVEAAFKLEVASIIAHKLAHRIFWDSAPPVAAARCSRGKIELESTLIEGAYFDPAFALVTLSAKPDDFISHALPAFSSDVHAESGRSLLYDRNRLGSYFAMALGLDTNTIKRVSFDSLVESMDDFPADFVIGLLHTPQRITPLPSVVSK